MSKLISKGHIEPLWSKDEIVNLLYRREEFNDPVQLKKWHDIWHQPRSGYLYDMRHEEQPDATYELVKLAMDHGLEHVGVSYYVMGPGDNLPYHSDTYKKYIELFNLTGREKDIVRFIFFPFDWEPGHIFEIDGDPITQWKAGDWVAWRVQRRRIQK